MRIIITVFTAVSALEESPISLLNAEGQSPTKAMMNMSLADRFAMIVDSPNKEFTERLTVAVNDNEMALSIGQTKPQRNNVIGNIGIIGLIGVGTLILSDPTAMAPFLNDLNKAVSSVLSISWLPWMWMRPRTARNFLLADLIVYLHVFGRSDTVAYLRDHLWPTTLATVRKLFIAEIWNVFWSGAIYKPIGRLFPKPKNSDNEDEPSAEGVVPEWLQGGHEFLFKTMFKGTRKIFQSAIQKHIETFLINVAENAGEVLQDGVRLVTDNMIQA